MLARPWQAGLAGAAIALGWQWLVVAGYFHGQWSALFVTGDRFEQSPQGRAERTYVLSGSFGYDGQLYHTIAHDPLDLHYTQEFLDAPQARYSRILIPGLS